MTHREFIKKTDPGERRDFEGIEKSEKAPICLLDSRLIGLSSAAHACSSNGVKVPCRSPVAGARAPQAAASFAAFSCSKWIDGHIKGRAENSLLAHLYSCACTRVGPSVKRPGGKSCLQAGNATIFFLDRQQEQGGGESDGEAFLLLFLSVVHLFSCKPDTTALI